MPIIFNSSAFSSRGIALLSQQVQEAPSGLVTVSVEYALTQSKADSVSSLFYLDATPPIFPTVLKASDLQRGALFLQEFTSERQVGQITVSATYSGARLVRQGFAGLIERETELMVTPEFRVYAGYDLSSDETPQRIPVYDIVSVQFLAQTITRAIAGVYSAYFDREQTGQDAFAYISRIEYGSISRSAPQVREQFNLPAPQTILNKFAPKLNISTSIDNVTNAVIVATTTESVYFSKPEGDA
jgi:hypothetical protein